MFGKRPHFKCGRLDTVRFLHGDLVDVFCYRLLRVVVIITYRKLNKEKLQLSNNTVYGNAFKILIFSTID